MVNNNIFCNVWAGNLFNVHEDVQRRPSTWYVACFLPTLGADSRWALDDSGVNSKSVGRDHEGKREWLGSQTLYNLALVARLDVYSSIVFWLISFVCFMMEHVQKEVVVEKRKRSAARSPALCRSPAP